MKESTSREKVLKAIRKALIHKSEADFSAADSKAEIYTAPPEGESLEILFAKNFSALTGNFIFCEKKEDFTKSLAHIIEERNWDNIYCLNPPLQDLLKQGGIAFSSTERDLLHANIGITTCECLVARTGSIMVSSRLAAGRRLPVYSNVHITVAYTSQLVYNIGDGYKLIQQKYGEAFPSQVTVITGPSQTADIEKTLVKGAHGPKELFLFLIDDGTA